MRASINQQFNKSRYILVNCVEPYVEAFESRDENGRRLSDMGGPRQLRQETKFKSMGTSIYNVESILEAHEFLDGKGEPFRDPVTVLHIKHEHEKEHRRVFIKDCVSVFYDKLLAICES